MSNDVYEVAMPKLGETVTEGVVSRWLKQAGDTVAFDDPLFEVSTDKVDSEVPSPYDGVLLEILVNEGETVPVGTPVARIGEPGAQASAAPAPVAPQAPSSAAGVSAGDEVVKLSRMRLITADLMVKSLKTSAHVWTSVEVDFERVEQVRQRHKEQFRKTEGASLTYLPFNA